MNVTGVCDVSYNVRSPRDIASELYVLAIFKRLLNVVYFAIIWKLQFT